MKNGQRNGIYNKHIFSNVEEIILDFNKNQSTDSKRMQAAMKPMLLKLQKANIHELRNISQIFKNCGLNNKSTNQIATFLLEKLYEKKIQKREIAKLNNTYRNIIFNSLFNDFPDKIVHLIDHYITNYCSNIYNHNFLLCKIKEHIQGEIIKLDQTSNQNYSILTNINSYDEINLDDKLKSINDDFENDYFNENNEDDFDMDDFDHYFDP